MTKKERCGAFTRACITRMAPFRACGEITIADSCCRAIARFGCGASAGKSFGDFNSPFASFYFGAFGNNYIDHLSIDRYREFYSFPGVGIDAIGARSFGKLLGEYNLPPKRFREFGTTWLYVNWARFTLFSSGLLTNFTSDPSRANFVNLGTQLDVRLVLFTYLNSTFSGGYAAAEHDGHITTEYMVSLKIL